MPARVPSQPAHEPARPSGQHLAPVGRGKVLPPMVQAKMEAAFGHDFSSVRIHEGGHAESLGAIAYTRGRDIHFAPGRYSPQSRGGQELLGHELAHVVQQSKGRVAMPQGAGAPINADPGLEAEAERLGRAAARGHSPSGFTVTPAQAGGEAGGPVQRAQPYGRVIQPAWGEERVYGHDVAPGEHTEEESAVVAQIRGAVDQAKAERRRAKQAVLAQVLKERAKFGPDQDKEAIRKEVGGAEFFSTLFGPKGSYVPALESTQVTSDKIRAQLGEVPGLELLDHPDSQETRVHWNGKHLYTFYRGQSAFVAAGATKAGRGKFSKHGSTTKYVADDRGTPTRRYAYGVKDATQVALARGAGLKGRYASGGKELRSLVKAEYPLIGRKYKAGKSHTLTDNQLLFLHQEHGSSNSQRGVSLASTEYPLLSNAGRGFASAADAGTRKLKIDLGKVPPPEADAAPNLINYYQRIPGFADRRVVASKHSLRVGGGVRTVKQPEAQQHFDWSTSKNRELFLRELLPTYVKGQKVPSKLEDQTYASEEVDELLAQAKGQAYEPF